MQGMYVSFESALVLCAALKLDKKISDMLSQLAQTKNMGGDDGVSFSAREEFRLFEGDEADTIRLSTQKVATQIPHQDYPTQEGVGNDAANTVLETCLWERDSDMSHLSAIRPTLVPRDAEGRNI